MEPLHITEFASKRYYEKLQQLPKEHEQEREREQEESLVVDGSSSKFILPIRQAEHHSQEITPKHAEQLRSDKEKEKRRLFGRLRSSKSSVSAPEPPPVRRPSFTSVASSHSIGGSPAVQRKRYAQRLHYTSANLPPPPLLPPPKKKKKLLANVRTLVFRLISSSRGFRPSCRFRSLRRFHCPTCSTCDWRQELGTAWLP